MSDGDPAVARFVAIANGAYVAHRALERAVPDARSLAIVLQKQHGFDPVVLEDYDRGRLLDAVDEHLGKNALTDAALILIWIGHGEIEGTSLRLLGQAKAGDREVAQAGMLGEWAARTGAQQVLVLIDTCYSGAAVIDAARLAKAVDEGRKSAGTAWFGVVAASLGDEPALSGALVRAVTRLLSAGPREPDFRWDPSRPHIDAHDLVQWLLKDWDEPRQRPIDVTSGVSRPFVRNPLYRSGALDEPVEHLLFAARGSGGNHSFFAGREGVLRDIVDWMRGAVPGLYVLTGPPGCGKSAVAGRIVSLSSRSERAQLLRHCEAALEPALDPGQASVDAQLHARGVTVETAAESLARQLDVDPPQLSGLLEFARLRKNERPLTIVIDGLDEARLFAVELAVRLVAPLAAHALVLVATRDVAAEAGTLIAQLGPASRTFDLGRDADATLRDVSNYVEQRLADSPATMDPAKVATALTRNTADAGAPFLLARLVTSQLRAQPVDTSAPKWELALATTVESALERDLQAVVLDVDGAPDPAAARDLMTALALSRGGGLPVDDLWPAIATAIAGHDVRYGRDQAFAVLEQFGRHIVAGMEGDEPSYRLAHQQLVDYLVRDDAFVDASGRPDRRRRAVAAAVFATYERLLDAGLKPRSHGYLWRYAWYHLAEGGEDGLASMRVLAERDRDAFQPDLALALELTARNAWLSGALDLATSRCREAIVIWQSLGDQLRRGTALFQLASILTDAGEAAGAEEAASEAAEIARALVDEPGGAAFLGATLVTHAMSQLNGGNLRSAKRLADEAIVLNEAATTIDAESRFQARAAALSIASKAALLLGDAAEASRLAESAVDVLDRMGDADAVHGPLNEALATVAGARFVQVLYDQVDPAAGVQAAATAAGARLVATYRRTGARHTLEDLGTARGLLAHARGVYLDGVRGLPQPDYETDAFDLADATIALTAPFAEQVPDAALLAANALVVRAALRATSDGDASAADAAQARQLLRRFADRHDGSATLLGELLDADTAQTIARVAGSPQADWDALIVNQREAIALLRRSASPLFMPMIAQALSRLVALMQQQGTSAEIVCNVRADAIAAWRALTVPPHAKASFVVMLSDQAAALLDTRPAEAADLGREACALAQDLGGPQGVQLLALSRLNLSAALMALDESAGSRELLRSVLDALEPVERDPLTASVLATAYGNLAQLDVADGRFTAAEPLARRALALYDTPGVTGISRDSRWIALLALGSAERGNGDEAQGMAHILDALGPHLEAAIAGTLDTDRLAMMLNVNAPDMWDDVLARFAAHPQVRSRLALRRVRPPEAIADTVRELSGALAAAPTDARLHSVVRLQRARLPSRFDDEWRAQTGESPTWLHVDPTLEATMLGWLTTASWRASRDSLEAHPNLLDPMSDLLIDELASPGDEASQSIAHVHHAILAAARDQGVAAAYVDLLLGEEIHAWLASDDAESYLAEHQELLRPEVATAIDEFAAGDDRYRAFAAVLRLAHRGEQRAAFKAWSAPDAAIDAVIAAMQTPDMTRLAALASIVRVATDDVAIARTATTALAVAMAVDGDFAAADAAIDQATANADSAESERLSEFVAGAIGHQPRAGLALARLLQRIADAMSARAAVAVDAG